MRVCIIDFANLRNMKSFQHENSKAYKKDTEHSIEHKNSKTYKRYKTFHWICNWTFHFTSTILTTPTMRHLIQPKELKTTKEREDWRYKQTKGLETTTKWREGWRKKGQSKRTRDSWECILGNYAMPHNREKREREREQIYLHDYAVSYKPGAFFTTKKRANVPQGKIP